MEFNKGIASIMIVLPMHFSRFLSKPFVRCVFVVLCAIGMGNTNKKITQAFLKRINYGSYTFSY